MPDDAIAATGSGTAHDLLQQYVLDPAKGELGLVHGKAGGKVQDCTVTLTMSTVALSRQHLHGTGPPGLARGSPTYLF